MEKHDLLHEFPDFKEKIHELKISDSHFRKLFDEYDALEHEVHRINTGSQTSSDEYTHKLKAKLLYTKDEIFTLLSQE